MSRRRVTFNQLEALWEILNENRALATGYNKSSQAREYSRRMWQIATNTLNSQGDGAQKDWKSWCKYWNDYKSKLKSKVASARAALHRTGGGPSHEGRLSDLELKFIQLLGEDFGSGLPGVRVEPFDIPTEDRIEAGSAPLLSAQSEESESILAPHGNIESVELIMIPPEPIAAAPTPPTLAMSPPPPPAPASAPRTSSTPRHSPRRRQRQRRVIPMSTDTARRALVNMSEERVKLDERRNQILENLTLELREIKSILIARLPALPTADEQA